MKAAGWPTEDGVLAQIEISFAQRDFVATPRRAPAGSVHAMVSF